MDCTNSDKTTQSNQYYYNSPPAAQTNAQDYYNQNQPLVPQFHSHPPEQSLQNPPESHSVSIIDKKEEGIPPPPSTTSLDTTGLIQRTYVPPAPAEEALRKLPNQYRDESIIPVSLQKYISPKQEGFLERFCCYCCPRKRKHRLICCGFITVVVIVMAVLIGVYIPRFPEIKVYSVNLQNLANMNTPYSFTYKNPAKPNLNELILQMNLSMEVGTYNSNLYGLNVDEINLVANLMVNESYVYNPLRTNSLTSYGSLVKVVGLPSKPADPSYYPSNTSQVGIAQRGSIYFPSKQWVNYTMMFQFSYTPDPVVGLLKDPTILDLADVCGITSKYTPRRPMRIHYDAKSTIAILKPLGYAPSLSNNIFINCPFSTDQINAVITAVQSGDSPYDAIKSVFMGTATSPGNTSGGDTAVASPVATPPTIWATENNQETTNSVVAPSTTISTEVAANSSNVVGIPSPTETSSTRPTTTTNIITSTISMTSTTSLVVPSPSPIITNATVTSQSSSTTSAASVSGAGPSPSSPSAIVSASQT